GVDFRDCWGGGWVSDTDVFPGAGGGLLYTSVSGGSSPGDGVTYNVGRQTIYAPGQLVNSATPAAWLTLSPIVGPGKYRFQGQCIYTPNQAAGAAVFQWGGTATLSNFRVTVSEFASGSFTPQSTV